MPWHQRGTQRYLESTGFYGPFPIAYGTALQNKTLLEPFYTVRSDIWKSTGYGPFPIAYGTAF